MTFVNMAKYGPWTLDAANENTLFIPTYGKRNAVYDVTVSSSFSGTIKFYSSTNDPDTRPDFSETASATNFYKTTDVIYLGGAVGGSKIDGDTGFVATGSSDGLFQVEVNQNKNNWLGVKMTARAAGEVTLSLSLSDNS